jgi:hypothetical protein
MADDFEPKRNMADDFEPKRKRQSNQQKLKEKKLKSYQHDIPEILDIWITENVHGRLTVRVQNLDTGHIRLAYEIQVPKHLV